MTSLRYDLSVRSRSQHLFAVTLTIPACDTDVLTLSLPAWIPGSYMVRDFARHIITLTATVNAGNVLPVTKTDKQEIVFGKNELLNKLIDFKEIKYNYIEFSSINADKKSVQKIIYEFFNKSESIINPPSLWVDRVFSIEGRLDLVDLYHKSGEYRKALTLSEESLLAAPNGFRVPEFRLRIQRLRKELVQIEATK